MAKSETSKRDQQQEVTRRALFKWSIAAGAALGVSKSKVFEILEKTAGKGIAQAAAESPTTRFVGIVAGDGGAAWFQQMWGHYDIVRARNPQFAWTFPGQETEVAGTTKPLVVGPATPWRMLPAARQVTIFQAGANETHTPTPQSVVSLGANNIFSVASALQAVSPSVIPIVTIGPVDVGTAPGSARPANVGNADGIVGLFNSAASRMGGLLSVTKDANLYKAHFDAFAQLNRAANRSTTKSSYLTASNAAQYLGLNLAAKLQITPEDLARYGINGGTPNNVAAIGRTFIVTIKAFKMGLTNAVIFPAWRDDPHGYDFTPGRPMQHMAIFDAFMNDLINTTDENTLKALADDTVIAGMGDTTKSPLQRGGWPDNTPQNSNVIYVYGAGHLKTGWFGGTDRNGQVQGFTNTGAPAAYNGANTARLATAAIAYAIAKRDERALSPFANGINLSGLVNPKDQ